MLDQGRVIRVEKDLAWVSFFDFDVGDSVGGWIFGR